jgi:PEP-CTERM motif
MNASVTSSRTGRRLTASGRARRAKRAAARRRRQMILAGAIAFTAVVAAPLSVASYLGVEAQIPGVAAAKTFMAMMSERSPGDRTKAELTRAKHRAAAPKQRALGKITPPPPPKEFVEAIAPPPPKIAEGLPLAAAPATLGPLLIAPSTPGGIVFPPSAPTPGGTGGPTPPGVQEPTPPGVEEPIPPGVEEPTPTTQPPPPGDDEPPPMPSVVPEPETWATMLLGFGLTGLMMRRRRRKTALA